MGTLVAGDVIQRVSVALFDTNQAKWSSPELLGYLNDGQRVIGTMQPTGTQAIVSAPLRAGARQSIPSNGWLLIDVIRNMGADGLTPGRSIRIVSRRLLDGYDPDWMTERTPTAEAQSFFYDLRDQASFFVYPPSTGGVFVEINYAVVPVPLTSLNQSITIFDVMEEEIGRAHV